MRARLENATPEDVRRCFSYSPVTGVLRWKIPNPNASKIKPGQIAGSDQNRGYRVVLFKGKKYLSHRLAWAHFYGEWPNEFVDHKNGNRKDNRVTNLRDVPQTHNAQNQKRPQKNNKTGFLGVYKMGEKFAASVRIGARLEYLGVYESPEEAHAVYLAAKQVLHPGYHV